ncbi:DUF5592 family protein [Clostridium faecium]|uniref:Uncharacterized protein n=1 Tax=Clostridium faecium TaxID=2762223 RepID=A0ABR8YNR4_9CLOT|nr:DUF5592 family protein [Clostridium faecium]MBD8045860.1 hypothetical protein [Clostridium faecium]
MQRQYTIHKEIASEMKFTKSIYLFDLASIIISLALAWLLSPLVYNKLLLLYYGYVILSIIFLVGKSKSNPGKRNFQSIYLALTRNRTIYSRD